MRSSSSSPLTPANSSDTPKPHARPSRFSLLILQSILCGIAVLLVLLLRLVGGPLFDDLRQGFRQATEDHRLWEQWENAVKPSGAASGSGESASPSSGSGTSVPSSATAASSFGTVSGSDTDGMSSAASSGAGTSGSDAEAAAVTDAAMPASEGTVPGTSFHD